MIWRVYQQAKKVIKNFIVATDDERIMLACSQLDINAILALTTHRTGVDRLAEVAGKITADYYLLIQGDEPLIEDATIYSMCETIKQSAVNNEVFTFRTPIHNPIDVVNSTTIKLVSNVENKVLFASRSPIPYPKGNVNFLYCKSVGVYAYPYSVLMNYPTFRTSYIESAEDHDFMRLLENEITIRAFLLETITISVDTPKDLERVRKIVAQRTE